MRPFPSSGERTADPIVPMHRGKGPVRSSTTPDPDHENAVDGRVRDGPELRPPSCATRSLGQGVIRWGPFTQGPNRAGSPTRPGRSWRVARAGNCGSLQWFAAIFGAERPRHITSALGQGGLNHPAEEDAGPHTPQERPIGRLRLDPESFRPDGEVGLAENHRQALRRTDEHLTSEGSMFRTSGKSNRREDGAVPFGPMVSVHPRPRRSGSHARVATAALPMGLVAARHIPFQSQVP